jgi:hypothetical protein
MKMDAIIIHFWAHSYRTGNILSIGYKFLVPRSDTFSTPVHGAPKGLLQTADSIFIEFISLEYKKTTRNKKMLMF